MKPSFSLKWLFVGIAFMAVLCGWSADHRRLTERNKSLDSLSRQLVASERQRAGLIEHFVAILQMGAITYSQLVADDDGFFLRLYGEGGTLNDDVAKQLSVHGSVVEMWLDNTNITQEGMKAMATRFEHERAGPSTDHFIRRGHSARPRLNLGRR